MAAWRCFTRTGTSIASQRSWRSRAFRSPSTRALTSVNLLCRWPDKQSNEATQRARIASKHWESGRNHNPRVGGWSPSSGTSRLPGKTLVIVVFKSLPRGSKRCPTSTNNRNRRDIPDHIPDHISGLHAADFGREVGLELRALGRAAGDRQVLDVGRRRREVGVTQVFLDLLEVVASWLHTARAHGVHGPQLAPGDRALREAPAAARRIGPGGAAQRLPSPSRDRVATPTRLTATLRPCEKKQH